MKLFCDLASIAARPELVSEKREAGKWQAMEYTTKLGKGRLLFASEKVQPEPVMLELGLSGWHKIYIGHYQLTGDNQVYLKLTDEPYYTPMRCRSDGSPHNWKTIEYMQEVYWKCADLTGQQLELKKPELTRPSASGIAWIRCEEMTEEEVARYKAALDKPNKCLQMHFDPDSFKEDKSEEKWDNFSKLKLLEHTSTKFCSLEYSMMFEEHPPFPDNADLLDFSPTQTGRYTVEEVYEKYVQMGREMGVALYASERMSVANFHQPYTIPDYLQTFVNDHPEYYIHNRDGSRVQICSYAYPEVQDYVIARMVKMIRMGFDGITMFWHRGVHIGFEQPVLDRCRELYPDLDPHRVPVSDPRLHGVWCEFLTGFMRRAKAALTAAAGRRVPVNVIVDYGMETAKHFGLDVARWAKEGLIDSVSHTLMETLEDLTGCMSDTEPDLIDLEKYRKENLDRQLIYRIYSSDLDKICRYIPDFLALEQEYGITVYHSLPWPHTVLPEEFPAVVERMRQAGAKRFLCWNGNHMLWDRALLHLILNLGNDPGVDLVPRRFIKTLSLDGHDISHVMGNWRG